MHLLAQCLHLQCLQYRHSIGISKHRYESLFWIRTPNSWVEVIKRKNQTYRQGRMRSDLYMMAGGWGAALSEERRKMREERSGEGKRETEKEGQMEGGWRGRWKNHTFFT